MRSFARGYGSRLTQSAWLLGVAIASVSACSDDQAVAEPARATAESP
jgi:hypothetical protein